MPHKRSPTATFHFLVSSITTPLVDVEPMHQLINAAKAALRRKKHGLKLDGIVLFPIVADKSIYSQADFIVHKRASNAFYIGQNIDFATWKRARRPQRVRLALRNFQSSIQAIPDRHVCPDQKTLLISVLETAAQKVLQHAA